MRTGLYRVASLCFAMACGAVIWQVVNVATEAEWSLLMAVVVAIAIIGSLTGIWLALLPQASWEKLKRRAAELIERLRHEDTEKPYQDNRRGWLLIVIGFTAYIAICFVQLNQPDDPTDDDQSAFLLTADEVHARGGPVSLIRDLYAGDFAEANRHPLYIGLLSLKPTHVFGRRLSFSLGLLTLFGLTLFVRTEQGSLVAGVFALLLGTNAAFCLFSTRAVCDVLMVTWAGLAYLLLRRPSLIRVALAGAVLGLTYLTKGTGLLLLCGFVIWSIIRLFRSKQPQATADADGQRRRWLELVLAIIAWVLVTSPLLVRNIRTYGSPFYNVNSSLLFVDAYEDPVALSQRQSSSEALQVYLSTHSASDIVRREASGLVWETFIILRLLGPAPLDDARVLIGLPLAACVFLAVLAHRRDEHSLLSLWLILCMTVFAWYISIAAGDRFPLPLLAPLLMLASEGIVRIVELIQRYSSSPWERETGSETPSANQGKSAV